MSILTILALPSSSRDSASSSGAITLQGPHHSAVNSTRTGSSLIMTCCSKSRSLTVGSAIARAYVGHPRRWRKPLDGAGSDGGGAERECSTGSHEERSAPSLRGRGATQVSRAAVVIAEVGRASCRGRASRWGGREGQE